MDRDTTPSVAFLHLAPVPTAGPPGFTVTAEILPDAPGRWGLRIRASVPMAPPLDGAVMTVPALTRRMSLLDIVLFPILDIYSSSWI